MALISPKNFLAPLSNKVHLGTIVFAVLLFAAFRAMGGAFTAHSASSSQPRHNAGEIDDEEVESQKVPVTSASSDEDLLNSTLSNQRAARRSNVEQESSSSRGNANDLTEIERRLGLR